LVLALLGASTLGFGVVTLSWPVSIAGTALLILGASGSLHGGVLYDAVPAFALRKELQQVHEGQIHKGVVPGASASTSRARDQALYASQTLRGFQFAAHRCEGVRWAPVAGWTLLVITSTFLMVQWEMVAPTTTGRSNSFRDTGLIILLGLSGLRVAVAAGRQVTAALIAGLSGLGLLLGGVLASHDHVALAIVEIATGGVAILCSLVAWVSPRRQKSDGLAADAG
jgi:hypothetical protein